ncbi:MAG: GNAT family N-acetyltransferase [Oscillochloris sp.]|nr:GNAT family N-acetyltransferase [Oscillochloris sp.]
MNRHAEPEIIPFDSRYLDPAAALLAARHARDRAGCAWLPELDHDAAAAAITAAFAQPGAAAAALIDGQLAGFLLGDLQIDQAWGRSAWMRLPAWAIAPGLDLRVLGALYGVVGAWWLRQGIFDHYVVVPAADPTMVLNWVYLGFAIQQVYALGELADREPYNPPADLTIRRAGPADRQTLAELSGIIWSHQIRAPIWAMTLPERLHTLREGYAEMADDAEAVVWLALRAGEVLGFQAYFPAAPTPGDLLTPSDCIELSVAGTRPEARGQGVAAALTAHGLAAARLAGARVCLTDWRSANLAAAYFWPQHGFTPVAYRMVRYVDPRIAWTHAGEGVAG